MKRITRTLGLFAPLLVTILVSVAVVLLIVRAPRLLIVLAGVTLALFVVAILAAVVLHGRSDADRGGPRRAVVRAAVAGVARAPEDRVARRELASYLGEMDEVRAATDSLLPQHRDTVRRVLRELGATTRLQKAADVGGRWARVMAARNLAWLAPADVVWRLDALARDDDRDVALAGALGLAAIPQTAAYRALLRLLDVGTLPPSRLAAILEESACPDPVAVLLQEVPDAPPVVRFWGAYLAGRTLDPRAIELLASLADDEDPNVRANAAEALAAVPGPDSMRALLRLSADDAWFVRSHAARALGERGARGERGGRGVDRLAELLTDENWWVRENAAGALSRLGDSSVPALRHALHSSDRFARNKAAEVLVGLGFVEREIRKYLEGNGDQWLARDNLVALGRAEVLSSLSDRFLSTGNGGRREELARVLLEIGDARLRPTLGALMRNHWPEHSP